jgi:hypothetical protein
VLAGGDRRGGEVRVEVVGDEDLHRVDVVAAEELAGVRVDRVLRDPPRTAAGGRGGEVRVGDGDDPRPPGGTGTPAACRSEMRPQPMIGPDPTRSIEVVGQDAGVRLPGWHERLLDAERG